ncbi:MAG: 1-acyl-sn-glycerol-3-phosphate acyltransferase [Acidobacteria bacterium]|nr:1-acyl-sn-glycerol-3-phosphate acyltransferase [Acidobacteriota bacterium]
MSALRSILRVAGAAAVTAAGYAVLAAASPARRGRVVRLWARAMLRILGARLEVRGKRPEGPFLLVANHLGYVDVLVLASQLDCVFVAKDDVASWPLVGRLCRTAGTLFVSRERKSDAPRAAARIESALREGRSVVLFPEGTSSEGATVLPFKSALLGAAARAGVPVACAALTYATSPGDAPARLAICWWGDMEFTRHLLDLLRLPRFAARLSFGAERVFNADRKVLAVRLWHSVRRQFEPVTS